MYFIRSLKLELSGVIMVRSNDPAVNVIFCEDVAAVVGIGLAGLSTTLTLVTGSTIWDAMGSLAVGSLLALVSGYIISTNASMLLGNYHSFQ